MKSQVLCPTQHKTGHFGHVSHVKPISWLGMEKVNLTQQKHTSTNENKCTVIDRGSTGSRGSIDPPLFRVGSSIAFWPRTFSANAKLLWPRLCDYYTIYTIHDAQLHISGSICLLLSTRVSTRLPPPDLDVGTFSVYLFSASSARLWRCLHWASVMTSFSLLPIT